MTNQQTLYAHWISSQIVMQVGQYGVDSGATYVPNGTDDSIFYGAYKTYVWYNNTGHNVSLKYTISASWWHDYGNSADAVSICTTSYLDWSDAHGDRTNYKEIKWSTITSTILVPADHYFIMCGRNDTKAGALILIDSLQ